MSFTSITTGEIETGKPVTNTTLDTIRSNLDDLDSRLVDVETGGDTEYPPIIFTVNGKYGTYTTPRDELLRTTLNFSLKITGVRIIIQTAGSSGTTEVDLEFKRGAGAWTSVLTTKPSVTSASGDNAISTNAVMNETYWILESGDLLRLNLTSKQGGTPIGFMVRVDYSKSS